MHYFELCPLAGVGTADAEKEGGARYVNPLSKRGKSSKILQKISIILKNPQIPQNPPKSSTNSLPITLYSMTSDAAF
jgi:hypothetical protein